MNTSDVIIIGAGAAGLIAARELSKSGLKVIVLEAKDRIGGRAYTINSQSSEPIEGGAEFVHGKLPITLSLVKEAGLELIPVSGDAWQAKEGSLIKVESFIEGWPLLIQKLKELKSDITIKEFLDLNFSDPAHQEIKESITSFVEGYDAADPSNASTVSLREEWLQENENEQFRIEGGYGKLMHYLESSSRDWNASFYFNSPVKEIQWNKNKVTIVTANLQSFHASKALITVPIGVLAANDKSYSIAFKPEIKDYINAAREIGFGSVIKIVLEFNSSFWKQIHLKNQNDSLEDMGFIFSKASVPTWWTQHPKESNVLTGWLAGPKSKRYSNVKDEEIITLALISLSEILGLEIKVIKEQLKLSKVFNWNKDPFTQGGYGYAKLKTKEAKLTLNTPIENTIYFAGEGLYQGPETGTVEAALVTGFNAAQKIGKVGF
jgi:monoamine oxidase